MKSLLRAVRPMVVQEGRPENDGGPFLSAVNTGGRLRQNLQCICFFKKNELIIASFS